jgi:hypothetical protein
MTHEHFKCQLELLTEQYPFSSLKELAKGWRHHASASR